MMMHPTIDIKQETSEAVGIKVKKSSDLFSMQVFHKNSVGRIDAENFIKQGFSKSYGANISISMPQILTVKNGNFKAALGIRSAKEPLFIEQYLSTPIEQTHALIKENITRSDIVEIGSLYSNAIRFTLPLFLVTAVSLFYKNYQYVTFAGTTHVLNILSKAGVDYSIICDAQKNALTPSSDDWGRYYDTNPKVVVVSLSSVLQVIDKQVKYQNLFKSLEKKIADVCQQLAEQS